MPEYTPIVLINFLRKTLPPGDTIPAEAVTNLVDELAAKAPAEHSHTKEEIEAVLIGQITSHWHPSGGGGPITGTATVNFGAFPGTSDASIAVTGQTGIVAGSIVNAHKRLVATADHSADEHWVEEWDVEAGNIQTGVGFTIFAKTRNKRLYGQWNLAWSWS